MTQRAFRLAAFTLAFWHTSDPSVTERYIAYDDMIQHYTDRRALATAVLLEPLLSLCHSLYHHLPFRQQLVYSLLRMAIDFTFVVPTLALLLSSPRIDALAKQACTYLCHVLTFGDVSSLKYTLDTCQDSHMVSHFVPAVALTGIGMCVPLVTCYWMELYTKLQYLRARYPQHTGSLPGSQQLRALLLAQINTSLLLCFVLSAVAAMLY
jgi:hypothetical protein